VPLYVMPLHKELPHGISKDYSHCLTPRQPECRESLFLRSDGF
jgi:hypothetical protein